MKSILILVSAQNESFFGKEVEAIEETWAKTVTEGNYDNIEYFSYTAMTEEQRQMAAERLKKAREAKNST